MAEYSRSIYIIGAVPPPIGGISVHIERLAQRLVETGYFVEIFDYSGIKKASETNGGKKLLWSGSIILVFTMLFMRVVFSKPNLIHWHISVGDRFFKASYFAWLISLIVPTVVTIHATPIQESIDRTPRFLKIGLKRFFQSIKAVITVSQATGPCISREFEVPHENIHIIPAYLPTRETTYVDISRKDISRVGIGGIGTKRKIIAVATGYGTPMYWWDGLLDAIQQCNKVDNWNLVFYTTYNEPYFSELLKRIDEINNKISDKVRVYCDLPQREFLHVLSTSDLFVRPTLTDGDSIALREAISLGLEVIASDVVERPKGSMLFKTGDANDLLLKIEENEYMNNKEKPEEDFFLPVLNVYEKTIFSKSNG